MCCLTFYQGIFIRIGLQDLSMNEYLDSYFWFRGIGCSHNEALVLAQKEVSAEPEK